LGIADVPTGSKGEKRPADVIGNAVHVMRIAETSDVFRQVGAAAGAAGELNPSDDGGPKPLLATAVVKLRHCHPAEVLNGD